MGSAHWSDWLPIGTRGRIRSRVPGLDGERVVFVGNRGGYPWVKPIDGGPAFAWSSALDTRGEQLTLFGAA